MRVVYKIQSEKRKQDIYADSKKCVNTFVYGEYKKGCSLVKYIYPGYNVLLSITL